MIEDGTTLTAVPGTPSAPAGDVFVMPCSVSQKRYWMLDQISLGSTALVIPIAVQLSGPLDVDILEKALNAIVGRHEILRTHFAVVDGEPRQVIASEAPLVLHRIDPGPVAPEQYREQIERLMSEEARRPVSMTEAPVMRATLVRLSSRESVLMLTAHHIISDGWSNGVLVRELGLFYDAFRRNKPVDLSPLAIQYADYALWQEEWLKTDEFQKQLAHWREALVGDLPVLDFPTDFVRRAGESSEAVLEALLLPMSLTGALKRFCQEKGITLFMVFFSAYVALLHRYTGQAQVMVGTTAANRNRPELEALVGIFANLLLFRSDLSGRMTARDFLLYQRDHLLGGFANHEVPFERILEELQARKSGVPRTLLQTHFLFQKAFMQPTVCGDLAIQPLYSVSPGSTFELAFGIVERAEGIRLQMEYRTSLFRQPTIRRLLLHFQALLESIVDHPETPIDELSLFAGNEREELEAGLSSASPVVNPEAIFKSLEQQLEHHLQNGDASSFTSPAELPPGTVLIALDDHLRLLPVGIPGDLYLGPVSSDLKDMPGHDLVSGPSDAATPVPLVKTGFVGRNAEGGRAELWGRREDLVHMQGFRFNLRAIEARLRLHPGVVEAAVVVQPPSSDQIKLTGYVVPRAGAAVTGEYLRAFLRGKVSDFILPSAILTVSSLPRDARGKILAEHLPPPAPDAAVSDHVPMRGILHQQLLEIWEEILKTSDLTIDDNFFECGGNSFLALRMMLQAGKLCGRTLPLSLLITGATVANLARFIVETGQEGDAAISLIPLETRGTRTPLFFLHGDWAGGGFYCTRLSRKMGKDQPFYVLPPYYMREERVLTVKEMAACHLAAIRKQSPHGPYILGGYCVGAAVAMEIARQLIAENETVTHLFLADPPVWESGLLRHTWPLVNKIGDIRKWSMEKKIDVFDRSVVPFNRWLKKPLSRKLEMLGHRLGWKHSSIEPADAASNDADLVDSFAYSSYILAYRLYKPEPLSVPAAFYFPESTSPVLLARLARSSRMDSAKYTVDTVPGDHTTCVTKHTPDLAEKMGKKIASL